ncbi:hypothetical protein METBIDRAFT_30066 [Metschnikowia bicuspidata var. bicuspidata NRRL YB-4993]|uniref:Dynein heavy chain, cytoplasmic n=1 Tax=Metschnikowia bicuspidata var. bicuspidata NRRL YB-4993 TaxID=869754 RepID=A0A1A0HHJ0_9ASCO|nr:hypothetical protein METBIDRAFT_30066 [Metschnikowia bicuspidata var. bicuspidata NRRL YB-4993]OBA23629.1 hypothetical protein METBIDRAFT_30066 [Metschnikowia bicuspidata var. bicuspidata NRRL YB-4993]
MYFDEANLLAFVQKAVQTPGEAPPLCTNWSDTGRSLAASFSKSAQPDALYVVVQGDSFLIVSDLTRVQFDFELLIVMMKQGGPLAEHLPLFTQIHVINIPGASRSLLPTQDLSLTADQGQTEGEISKRDTQRDSYGQIMNLVSLAITPYFDFIAQNEATDTSSASLSMAKKKFNELVLSLRHLQYRIQIPELLAGIPHHIHRVLSNPESAQDPAVLADSELLNDLTKIVNIWIQQVQAVTSMSKTVSEGNSLQDEVQFWAVLEATLRSLHEQTLQQEVRHAIDILNAAKRFQVTLAFQNNLGISELLEETGSYNELLKDLPISELSFRKESIGEGPKSLEHLDSTITTLFGHLKRWKGLASLALTRMIGLVELVLDQIAQRLSQLLGSMDLVGMMYSKFSEICADQLPQLFQTIDSNAKFMVNIIRELMRKRQEKFMVIKLDLSLLSSIRERVEDLKSLRMGHEDLLHALTCLEGADSQIPNITLAYGKQIASSSPFDFSKQGISLWETTQQLYMDAFEKVLENMSILINRNLDQSESFSEYISLFDRLLGNSNGNSSAFILLFIEDRHKLQILDLASSDIEELLKLSFLMKNEISKDTRILSNYNLICWELSFIAKADFYLFNLQKLLGQEWTSYSIGSKIESKIASYRQKVDIDQLFSEWVDSAIVFSKSLQTPGGILNIIDSLGKEPLKLAVNSHSDVDVIIDQEGHLLNIGFEIPSMLRVQLDRHKFIQPFMYSLFEHVNLLEEIFSEMHIGTEYGNKFGFTMEDQKQEIFTLLESVSTISWSLIALELNIQMNDDKFLKALQNENTGLVQINLLQESVHKFHVHFNILNNTYDRVYTLLIPKISTCSYATQELMKVIQEIQEEVNSIIRGEFCDLEYFVWILNEDIAKAIHERCLKELESFRSMLSGRAYSEGESHVVNLSNHILVFDNGSFLVNPPLEDSKLRWVEYVNQIIRLTETLTSITLSTGAQPFDTVFADYSADVMRVMSTVDDVYKDACEYLLSWLYIEQLFSQEDCLDEAKFPQEMSIENCLKTAEEILSLKQVFDSRNGHYRINDSMMISFREVESYVSRRFSTIESTILQILVQRLQLTSRTCFEDLKAAQRSLIRDIYFDKTAQLVLSSVGEIYSINSRLCTWSDIIKLYGHCQLYLYHQSILPASNWIHVEQLEGQLLNVKGLLARRLDDISSNFDSLALKFRSEWSRIQDFARLLSEEWTEKKPISPDLEPSSALAVVANYKSRAKGLSSQVKSLTDIAVSMAICLGDSISLAHLEDDIEELKVVWSVIQNLWNELKKVKTQKWAEVHVRGIKHQLEAILSDCNDCTVAVRQYSAFSSLQSSIKEYLKKIPILSELKSDAMKNRHWEQIFSLVGSKQKISDVVLVHNILDINFQMHEGVIRNVLEKANGEQLVQESLESIKNEWSVITFETFSHAGKCRLIKNWSFLFDQCNTNLGTLTTIKHSLFHSEFERERYELESKLTDLTSLLNTWIEVQRQWAYLDGIFGSNSEIKASLPLESSRFSNITFEFLTILKKVYTFNLVIDVLSIKDLHRVMQKLSDSLTRTVKGLSDFLDKQRDRFPRFFFIGNEDLLELLGSENDPVQINKHLKRMFPGISSISVDQESSKIMTIASPQGEVIILDTPVSLIRHRSLAEWLSVFETEVKLTVSSHICGAVKEVEKVCLKGNSLHEESIVVLLENHSHQFLIVAFQVLFTKMAQTEILTGSFDGIVEFNNSLILILSSIAARSSEAMLLSKTKSLIIESLHHREVLQNLLHANTTERLSIWNSEQLFYCLQDKQDPLERLIVRQGRFKFPYGFEYLGVVERLAITPLVNKFFLSMTQALAQKLGGSPFGPAGTGKTECVKALGQNFGRMVLVFCCDDSFDFQSMDKILLGICKVGCWVCFDEFNRLETEILSSLSTQIERIETSLQTSKNVVVSEQIVTVNQASGIFVTMNPEYVGRNELPENLKKLFRGFAMNRPDAERIAEVILTSHGFSNSKELSARLIPFFLSLQSSVSIQSHYDFGLRALKSILNKAGDIKKESMPNPDPDLLSAEFSMLLKSLIETIGPKLVKADEIIFQNMIFQKFFSMENVLEDNSHFLEQLKDQICSEGLHATEEFVRKAHQLFQIQESHHGFMLVGHSGSGKSAVMNLVLKTMSRITGEPYQKITIDSKVLTKDNLYGKLDPITRDWTDGLLTKVIREILANLKGESAHRTWIVFDGDIDPVWAENLNSLLDDNKLLTLPNGERLELPCNVRIVFEVLNLDYATPATVSRCAMIWFDTSLVNLGSLWNYRIHMLKQSSEEVAGLDDWIRITRAQNLVKEVADIMTNLCLEPLIESVFEFASKLIHIMETDAHRVLTALFVYLQIHISELLKYLDSDVENLEKFVYKALALSFIWAFSGDCSLEDKERLRGHLQSLAPFSNFEIPMNVSQCKISFPDFEWEDWSSFVEHVDLEPHQVLDSGTIVPTVDTVMHESLINGIINKHSPLILCGPPGSGKTMTFLKALRNSANLELISLNFSKDTTPEALLSTLEQHCEYRMTNRGYELSPKVEGKWAVVFCDEINLPAVDNFGTQRVISFMRQLVEHSGFWRAADLSWVSLRNIQFVGACNNPNDPGRNKLTERFMRHVTLVMVDYPGPQALRQIYSTFNEATLKCAPNIRSFSDALTSAMIEFYDATKGYLTTERQSHYVYSPRELTRWCRGILETLMIVTYSDIPELIRLWYHEGLRLFYDRLVTNEEKGWCIDLFWATAAKNFPGLKLDNVLKGPVLYSTWLSGQYESVSEEALATFVRERLRVFSEEEMEYNLILFEDMLDHALRIDRVLRQHQGHMILVGPSTSGKTCLTKFVTWMNGMKLVQLKVHSNYTITEFEASLREVLTCCAKGEQICFLIDESSILEASFIERMNSLLANSEIPGLFEEEELENLIKLCATEASARGILLDTADEIYEWFTSQISENLHVAFTMSELRSEKAPQINSSPALFNRCVLSWMGDWSDLSLQKVAEYLIDKIPLDQSNFVIPTSFTPYMSGGISSFREVVVDSIIFIHRSSTLINSHVVPKQFLDFIDCFNHLFTKGQEDLEESQRHTNIGLDKLRETVVEVSQMEKVMSEKKMKLQLKDDEARKMLNKMIVDQNESERKREFSVATKAELEKQEAEIEARRSVVMKDLELAEPAVLEAQRGVQNIKKQHLTELRSMSNPPASIKMAMESVCIILGYQATTWRDVQLIVRQDNFITKIVAFDNEEQLLSELRSYMEEVYLSRPDYNFETIHRASKACGPLLQWVIAQIRYSEILEKIGPLREQVAVLESYAVKSKAQLIAIADMISELEQSIETYKNEYSEVIRETEKIKTEMRDIELKVSRSMKLIENLTKERKRWLESTKGFQRERERLVGNCILGSAFFVYCGNLNQNERRALLACWKNKLTESLIRFDSSIPIASLLATSTEQNDWAKSGLPEDDLFVENFAIKNRSEFPLIIDPTGVILPVLKTALSTALILTSFLSESFTKTVEDALRFGGTVLVQNAELYNPILDSVLRKDVTRTGGRRVVRFGQKSMILLDRFRLLLYTRDSRAVMSPFIKARTSLLNFTITKSNLENRVLNVSLQHFNPDLDRKRIELGALQSEYTIRLLSLRKQLLHTLNAVRGTFLDNDDVIDSLEDLELESSVIDKKMSEGEKVMLSVNEVRLYFEGVASHLKNIFEILMALSETNRFYNFSFSGFIHIFKEVLLGMDATFELERIVQKLYEMIYSIFSPTLRESDKFLFRVCLAISYHSAKFGSHCKDTILRLLSTRAEQADGLLVSSIVGSFVTEEEKEHIDQKWTDVATKYENQPGSHEIFDLVNQYLGLNCTRDKYLALETYCASFFNGQLSTKLVLGEWILQTSYPHIFSSSETYDMTFQIMACAKSANVELSKVSMGTKEGITAANKALDIAMDKGGWVLVQNVQMSPRWLTHLKATLQSKPTHESFRLFLTCSLDSTNIPNELIGISSVRTTEVQPQWRTMLLDTFNSLVTIDTLVPEMQLYFLLSWYHTTIQERLKYVPVSFDKKYDINESDVIAAAFSIRQMFASVKPGGTTDISLTEIAFRVGEIIYGGKIAVDKDARYCAELAKGLFHEDSHKPGFNLINNEVANRSNMRLLVPDASSIDEYKCWIEQLPELGPLEWLGLESEVRKKAKDEEAMLVAARVSGLLRAAE